MFKLSETSRRLIMVMAAICTAALGIGVIITGIWFQGEIFKYIYGIIFGTAFSILKLLLLERSINKSLNLSQGQAQNYIRLHYMIRYFLTAAVLVIAAIKGLTVLIAVFICLMSLRPAIHIVNWQMKKNEKAQTH